MPWYDVLVRAQNQVCCFLQQNFFHYFTFWIHCEQNCVGLSRIPVCSPVQFCIGCGIVFSLVCSLLVLIRVHESSYAIGVEHWTKFYSHFRFGFEVCLKVIVVSLLQITFWLVIQGMADIPRRTNSALSVVLCWCSFVCMRASVVIEH